MAVSFPIEIIDGDIYLPELNLWLDADTKKEFGFISHAHMDHVKGHETILCSSRNEVLLRGRTKFKRFQSHAFNSPFMINDYTLTFYPAGHILGSTMLHIEKGGSSVLFSGDFKLNPSFSAEPIDIPKADLLIMESSFGREHFIFPSKEALLKQAKHALSSAASTPVFFSYTLGKSQETLMMLKELTEKTIYVQPSILEMNTLYRKLGVDLPAVKQIMKKFDPEGIYVIPVHIRHHHILKNQTYTAIYSTGWALDPEKRETMQCDICLPMSDHAGFDELLGLVETVQPKEIWTHHGRPDFADTLKIKGHTVTHIHENQYNEG